MNALQSMIVLLGRLCLSALFFYTVFYTATHWEDAVKMAPAEFPIQPALYTILITLVTLVGAVFLLIGWKTRIGAFLLLVATGVYIAFSHDFWNMDDPEKVHYHSMIFLMYLAVMGGLFYALACGCGSCGCDRCCSASKESED